MGQPLTSQEIVRQIWDARAGATQALELARDAAARFVRIEHDYETAWNSAFIGHKEAKNTDALARAKTDLDTADKRTELHQALEDKRLYKIDAETWQSVLEALKAVTYLVNRELRLEEIPA